MAVSLEVEKGEAPESIALASSRGIDYTQYEANAWACTFLKSGTSMPGREHGMYLLITLPRCEPAACAGVKVLCDPWLTGDLTFAGQLWLYRGKKTAVRDLNFASLGQGVDLLVLSQVRSYLKAEV